MRFWGNPDPEHADGGIPFFASGRCGWIFTEVMNITKYPLTIGLLCAIRIMVISKNFSNLVH